MYLQQYFQQYFLTFFEKSSRILHNLCRLLGYISQREILFNFNFAASGIAIKKLFRFLFLQLGFPRIPIFASHPASFPKADDIES